MFADIEQLAEGCRFRNCTHQDEPACAVRAAVDAGTLPSERVTSYQKLMREAEVAAARTDARLRAEQDRKAKTISKAAKDYFRNLPTLSPGQGPAGPSPRGDLGRYDRRRVCREVWSATRRRPRSRTWAHPTRKLIERDAVQRRGAVFGALLILGALLSGLARRSFSRWPRCSCSRASCWATAASKCSTSAPLGLRRRIWRSSR